ncbi:hypothetical protein COCCADRAFT_32701 [Bipolaris zeicola 26-R-13]|uniref:Uncharacterized protein n=1 Tax=Cochliobolus carbonum (strain 26-R-13) TaxID=930089 RepID=W6YFJ3_COCC2|nr:uncharacterized protein COCCADRAFT_32701 [Bipolaris zeicola 26-R-13]EUC38247.1 hypothetical protein COCCADRAFT_32701 [Bipolaris zeicola 26-R-13]
MAPPWVTFDTIESFGGDCGNGADPDIAGISVVISFVTASFMTTFASILAMLLDQAFDTKGQFTLRAPLRFIRERFLEHEWKKYYAWRPFLDPLIIGLGDQQLIVLLSGWIKVSEKAFKVQGAHFVLILYICALSSSSYLAALITLRKYFQRYRLIAKIRLILVICFAIFLMTSMMAAIALSPTMRLSLLVPFFLIIIDLSTALVCILYNPEGLEVESPISSSESSFQALVRRVTDRELYTKRFVFRTLFPARFGIQLMYYIFLNPATAFVVQILLAILSVTLVLTQKFAAPEDPARFCGLHDNEENTWGFGQTLTLQTYLEARQDISEGFRSTNV